MDFIQIKRKLEQNCCPVHHQFPEISISDNQINIKCCCESFKTELIELTKEYLKEQTKNDIENSMRNIVNRHRNNHSDY